MKGFLTFILLCVMDADLDAQKTIYQKSTGQDSICIIEQGTALLIVNFQKTGVDTILYSKQGALSHIRVLDSYVDKEKFFLVYQNDYVFGMISRKPENGGWVNMMGGVLKFVNDTTSLVDIKIIDSDKIQYIFSDKKELYHIDFSSKKIEKLKE